MAKKYIDAEKLYNALNSIGGCDAQPKTWADGWDKAIDESIDFLERMPAADVREVRHGEWCGTVCSVCGESTSFYYDCRYCPQYGARMDGGKIE